ncbi:MAG: N-acetylglucosamine-6-phosphate deacetylase, partial [Planctomycetes bacterium]|nr:N-acetylglucosamine-6-phosphate deacetylase [Planctomycetota bacterium]
MSGYVDLQVNGYAGVDFNADQLTSDEMTRACQQIRQDGTERILATIITAPMEQMVAKIQRMATWLEQFPVLAEVIAGIHVEGPFLNPADGFVGAHPADAVEMASIDLAARLVDCGQGAVRMLTLAPEADPDARVTRYLSDQGVIVAAGHSDASRDQLRQGIDNGLEATLPPLPPGVVLPPPRHPSLQSVAVKVQEALDEQSAFLT